MSQSIEEGFYLLATQDPGMAAAAGSGDPARARVYPLRLPDSATLPAYTYRFLGGPRGEVHSGDAGLPFRRCQVTAFATSYKEARAAAAAAARKFSGFRGACGTAGTIACDVEEMPDDFDANARAFMAIIDVLIQHQEGN